MRPLTATRLCDELEKCNTQERPRTVPNSRERRERARGLRRNSHAQFEFLLTQIRKKKDPTLPERCRPRVLRLEVTSFDPASKLTRRVDVAYLQDIADQLGALRQCILVMFGSCTEIYRRLDVNGSGSLSILELEKGLANLHVPWQQVTGMTRVELFKRVDPYKSGTVDILEFLGRQELTARPHWSQMDVLDQWDEYANKVIDLDLTNMEYNGPLWSSTASGSDLMKKLESMEEASKRRLSRNSRLDPAVFDMHRKVLAREDLDFIQTKVVKIEKFLKDYNENKRDLVKIKLDLANVTESQERLAELKRKRDEEEREKQRIKTEAGMALVSDGGFKISIFGKKAPVELSQFREPTEDDLPHFFSLSSNSGLVEESEIEFRNFLGNVGMSLVEGDKVRGQFLKHCSQDSPPSIGIHEFGRILSDLLKSSSLAQSRLHGYWTSVSSAKLNNRISLFEFIAWYSSFSP